MNKNKLDETNYTAQLAGDINAYVKANTVEKPYGAYTPHSTKQSFKNLNESSCFDLLYKITNSSILVLEIKVTHDGKKLHSFNSQQRLIDSALRQSGIPLNYCYNLKSDYSQINDEVYTLENSMVSTPEKVANDSGIIQNKGHHVTLLRRINYYLKEKSGSNTGGLGALFTYGLLESMQEVNTKLLFFAYSAKDEDLSVFSLEQLQKIYKLYRDEIHLAEDIDLYKATPKELKYAFKKNAEQLLNILDEKIALEQDNRKSVEDDDSSSIGMSM